MLVVYYLVLPLLLLNCIDQHDKTADHYDEYAPDHDLIHEDDHESVRDSAKQEHKRVNDCHVSLVVPLQAVVQRPVLLRWLYAVLQF